MKKIFLLVPIMALMAISCQKKETPEVVEEVTETVTETATPANQQQNNVAPATTEKKAETPATK